MSTETTCPGVDDGSVATHESPSVYGNLRNTGCNPQRSQSNSVARLWRVKLQRLCRTYRLRNHTRMNSTRHYGIPQVARVMMRPMSPLPIPKTYCLEHQQDEDHPSPRGLVCPLCHARITQSPPQGICRSYWESQPAAYTVHGDPCWVYTLTWADFRIRSLHWNGEQGLPMDQPQSANVVASKSAFPG